MMELSPVNSSEVLGLDEYASDYDLASEELFKGFSDSLMLFGAVCCLVFMVIGIPGNLITIIALTQYKKIRNATAVFIIHLHITDLIFCMVVMPIVGVTFYTRHWTTGKTMCRLYPMTKYMLTSTSLTTFIAIAINRYVMCCHPLLYPRLFRKKYICLMIIGIWLFSFVMMAPTFLEIFGRFSLNINVGFCTVIKDKNGRSPKMALLIIAFVIPCLIMSICYIRLMWVVRKSTRKSQQREDVRPDSSTTSETTVVENSKRMSEDGQIEGTVFQKCFKATFIRKATEDKLPNKKDRRLRTMIVIIMVTFCICRLPYLLTSVVYEKHILNPEMCIIGYTLMHSIHCINPIIYVLMSSEYRKAYKNLFKSLKINCVG